MSIDNPDGIRKSREIADEHYRNYQFFYSNKNYMKASEFLWGTINQLFYAIGLIHGEKLGKYEKIRKFLPDFVLVYDDQEIVENGFESAFVLHSNFYHNHLDAQAFEFHKEKVETLINKLIVIVDDILDNA